MDDKLRCTNCNSQGRLIVPGGKVATCSQCEGKGFLDGKGLLVYPSPSRERVVNQSSVTEQVVEMETAVKPAEQREPVAKSNKRSSRDERIKRLKDKALV